MAQLGMMDEQKDEEIRIMHNADEAQEEVVEEEYLDSEMMAHGLQMGYAEEEEVLCEDDDDDEGGHTYGGMDHHLYDAILEFKRTGMYPDIADQRVDRSAHCHWRLRCSRFTVHDDNVTLMYGSESTPNDHQSKYVIKKGEAKEMIRRVHELIGHVGTKRTQAAIQKKMYWRSVRNDVMDFITNRCNFCRDKKVQGKKLSKAPIDIASDSFDLDINVVYSRDSNRRTLHIALAGFDEEFVRQAAIQRMTTYTFRSTESPHRKTYNRSQQSFYKNRQPLLRRPASARFDTRSDHSSSFLVPVLNRGAREHTYLQVTPSRFVDESSGMSAAKRSKYMDDIEDEDDLTPVDPSVASTSRAPSVAAAAADDSVAAASAAGPSSVLPRNAAAAPRHRIAERQAKVYDPNHPAYRRSKMERPIKDVRHPRRDEHGAMRGAATRLSGVMTQNGHRSDGQSGTATSAAERQLLFAQSQGLAGHDLVTPYEDARYRPEFAPLPPILLIPSHDPEVAELQKELLTRQLEIQKLQMRVLQEHFDRQGGYEEVVEEDGRDVELNVIDNDTY